MQHFCDGMCNNISILFIGHYTNKGLFFLTMRVSVVLKSIVNINAVQLLTFDLTTLESIQLASLVAEENRRHQKVIHNYID